MDQSEDRIAHRSGKLIGLKPAGRLEPLAERLELERRHRLENVELRDQDLEDGEDALERVLRAKRIAPVEHGDDVVDDDEEHLVMLGPFGPRPLQREQLVNGQVAV